MTTSDNSLLAELIWNTKYRSRDGSGRPMESTLEESFVRVADSLSQKEKFSMYWRKAFLKPMLEGTLLPGGRIIANAGEQAKRLGRTLVNTFVMDCPTSCRHHQFAVIRQAAATMLAGGGLGCNFSDVPPSNNTESAVVSQLNRWDRMCNSVIRRANRGAMMGMLTCTHPEILQFVAAKNTPGSLSTFNLSVLVTDAFVAAVDSSRDWTLQFNGHATSKLNAYQLWEAITHSAYHTAEPGVVFIDRINALNKLKYCEAIVATNSCAEQPMPAYGATPLASINLGRLVRSPFSPNASLDVPRLRDVVRIGVRMLDNVLSVTTVPLRRQRNEIDSKRRIGLGVFGLADALAACRIPYNSPEAATQVHAWMRIFATAAHEASISLSTERGAFPLYSQRPLLRHPLLQLLDPELSNDICRHGIRNGTITCIAPTGSLALLAGNASSGIEPVYSHSHERTVILQDGSPARLFLRSAVADQFRTAAGPVSLPDYATEAVAVSPQQHLAIQAAAQTYIDGAISKTINFPENADYAAFSSVYRLAYELGCKSVSMFRHTAFRDSVLHSATLHEQEPTRWVH